MKKVNFVDVKEGQDFIYPYDSRLYVKLKPFDKIIKTEPQNCKIVIVDEPFELGEDDIVHLFAPDEWVWIGENE